MMTTIDTLQKLQRLGVGVTLHSETLKVQTTKGVLTPALRARLVEQKAALLTLLSSRQLLTDEQETPPIDMPQEEAHTAYARLQGVTLGAYPLGPGVIFPHTPLAVQVERGRIGVLLECPVHPCGRQLEYFFPHEVQSVTPSQQHLLREEGMR